VSHDPDHKPAPFSGETLAAVAASMGVRGYTASTINGAGVLEAVAANHPPIPSRRERRKAWREGRERTHGRAEPGQGTHRQRTIEFREFWAKSVQASARAAADRTLAFRATTWGK